MSGTDILDTETPTAPPGHHRAMRRGFLKRLSDRASLRTKLITAMLALVIMALAAISIASVFVLSNYLYTQRDNQLKDSFNAYQNVYANTSVTLNEAYQFPHEYGVYVAFQQPGSQLVSGQGPATNAPPGLGNSSGATVALPQLPKGNWTNANNWTLITTGGQSSGDAWRVLGESVQVSVQDTAAGTTKTETVNLVFAVDLGPVGETISRLITVELIVGAAIVMVLAVVGAAVVRANLQPLNDIELTAGQIAAGHLNHRVPEGDPRTEIGSLGRSLNGMLAQIERAFHAQGEAEQAAHESEERMRRFIADAAHELRTPLTTIRGFAAHYRQRGGTGGWPSRTPADDGSPSSVRTDAASSPGVDSGASGAVASGAGAESGAMSSDELDRLMGRVESEATRMGLLVEDLLTLARLDQQRPLSKGPVDLLSLAADAVQDARIVSAGRPISLSVAPGTAFIVDGDEARLRQVLANLVNNAITHTPAGTAVRVNIARGVLEASEAAGRYEPVPAVVLDVEDDGPGMSPEQARRVFERFYRADAARNRASGGTGLGLAIVAGLVSAHGGTVGVRTAPGRGADFQVKLPLSPDVLGVDDADDD